MPSPDKNRLDKIEELKNQLFSKNYEAKTDHHEAFSPMPMKDVSDSWSKPQTGETVMPHKESNSSMFKKFFIFSIIFFVLALSYAGYMFFAKGNTVSSENVEIAVVGNTFAAGGEDLSLVVEIANKNNVPLELVDLIVEFPKGSTGGLEEDTERLRQSLGTIPSGTVRSENIKMTLFGEQGSVRPVKISIEYRVEGSNAIFVKEKLHEVSINSTPLNMLVTAPSSSTPNQEIVLNIKSSLNATKPAENLMLRVDYPSGFQFLSSKPAPSFGTNIWELGSLAPGAEPVISITGKMLDVFDGEEKTFRVSGGSQSAGDKTMIDVVFNSTVHTVAIRKPLIEADLFLNGENKTEHASGARNPMSAEIRWSNNLDTKIDDLVIRAKITGNSIDRRSIDADRGFYNSSEDVIIWDKNYSSAFREVSPGQSGSVNFTFSSLPLFSASGGLTPSPSINIDVTISGKQSTQGSAQQDLSTQESSVVKIVSDVGLATSALHYSGPFTNSGPIPPKAERETTYTISWALSNTANSISKAKVVATLPSWVEFGESISPANADLVYDKLSREVVWNIGSIPKGTGITASPKHVDFKVKLKPSLSQVGSTPTLINEAVLTGQDDFASVDVRVNKPALNTRLLNDAAFPVTGDRVVE